MQKIAALHPGYFRIPGGNYLEGNAISTYFNWKNTIGPIENRPGHDNSAWGYWSQDGMGLLEYLEMAEEVGAQPILAVFAGYTLNGSVVAQSQLAPYVQDALGEIQYATGPTTSTYGAMRAADGHPTPFKLTYVEVGNEDFFDTSGSYNAYRFPMFYDAIKAAYPQLKIIATTNVTSRTPDVIDDHYYSNDPSVIAGDAHAYDSTSRSGPKHIIGEYAVTQGNPTGTLAAVLGEAAFLTGMERDADVVIGASYAPLLVNVNADSWPTNLIGYDGLVSYGSPSYYAQRMLGDTLGDQVAPSQIAGGNGNLWTVAATKAGGTTYLTVVNRGASAATINVDLAGVAAVSGGTLTVLTGDPTAMNSIAHPTMVSPTTQKVGSSGPKLQAHVPSQLANCAHAGHGLTPRRRPRRPAARRIQPEFAKSLRCRGHPRAQYARAPGAAENAFSFGLLYSHYPGAAEDVVIKSPGRQQPGHCGLYPCRHPQASGAARTVTARIQSRELELLPR
jgi:alpha-L-arabinofuranosidase